MVEKIPNAKRISADSEINNVLNILNINYENI